MGDLETGKPTAPARPDLNIAVIFAGGVGRRMHSRDIPKQFLLLRGKPIIVHTLQVFQDSSDVDAIVVACVSGYLDFLQKLVRQYGLSKVKAVVPGGSTGQRSIVAGLEAAAKLGGGDKSIVFVHDGVRPLITGRTIQENVESVKRYGSAVTSIRATETILVVDDGNMINAVPDRAHSRIARAPQSFYLKDILEVERRALAEGRDDFVDCCSLMTHYGKRLHLVEGPRENIKITTPDDFYTARALLEERENAQIYGLGEWAQKSRNDVDHDKGKKEADE